MRGIRSARYGLAAAFCWAPSAFAQDSAPAARFGAIQPLDEPAPGMVARGQSSNPMPMPPPATNGGTLNMPRPVSSPSVTEIKPSPAPAATFGQPVPIGQPFVVGQPYPIGGVVPAGSGMPVSGPAPCAPGTPCAAGAVPSVLPSGPHLDDPLFGGASSPHGVVGYGANRPPKWNVSADYLLWFTPSFDMPALVTTSPAASNGIIGNPGTSVLSPNKSFTDNLHSGLRIGGTYWMGCREVWGLDGNVWWLGDASAQQVYTSAANPVLARPFINLNTMSSFSEIIASPTVSTGAAVIGVDQSLWGAEANLRRYLGSTPCARVDALVGFRYMNLSEELSITESFARSPANPLVPGVPNILFGQVQDRFRTENHFYGTQVGAVGEVRRGRWFGSLRGTVAMGVTNQTVQINGVQNLMYDTGPVTASGGLLALPGANIGTFNQSRFAVLPEVGLQIGCHLTSHWRVAVGYNLLYLSSVVRPGDQIDPGLDVTRIPNFPLNPTPAPLAVVRPVPTMRTTDFFAQGISFSVQYTW